MSGGVIGIIDPLDKLTVPAKPFKLVNVIVAVPVRPEPKLIVVGLTLKPKSLTITLSLTALTSVSGLLSASVVA